MTSTCAINMMADVIYTAIDPAAALVFRGKVSRATGKDTLAGLPPGEQIGIMNGFWGGELEKHPNTTGARSWLEASENINGYVDNFRCYWIGDVIHIGLLR